MARIAINANVLQWVIDRSGLSVNALEKKFPLRDWEAGKEATLRQVENFAKKTKTPFGYLFLTNPPEESLPIPHFRTIDDNEPHHPSPDLYETIYTMQQRQAWMREYLVDEQSSPLPFVGSAKVSDSPKTVAASIRSTLGLKDGWAANFKTWTKALETLQVLIDNAAILLVVNGVVGNQTKRKLNVKEFRGFVLTDEYAPLVFVNGADGKAAQMFTLAHELAHVWFGSSAAFDLRQLQPAKDKIEQACDRVAAEVLVPEEEMKAAWKRLKNGHDTLDKIAENFKVSSLVAARRAQDLNLIGRDEFFTFYNSYQRKERAKKKATGGDFYAVQTLRIGRRFFRTVLGATQSGKLLYHDAYKLTGLKGRTFHEYSKKFSKV